jgi:large subunit ribosomal protein L24
MHIAKGDIVEVIAGDDAGKRGKVLKVFRDKNRVIVEKVNFIKRHTKPTQKNPTGGILEKEAPIHVSNVMLIDPNNGERTRVGFKRLADGRSERVSRKSGEMIPRNE